MTAATDFDEVIAASGRIVHTWADGSGFIDETHAHHDRNELCCLQVSIRVCTVERDIEWARVTDWSSNPGASTRPSSVPRASAVPKPTADPLPGSPRRPGPARRIGAAGPASGSSGQR